MISFNCVGEMRIDTSKYIILNALTVKLYLLKFLRGIHSKFGVRWLSINSFIYFVIHLFLQ